MKIHHSDFIGIIASIVKPRVYVELGLYHGETIEKIIAHCGEVYGVDLKSHLKLTELEKSHQNLQISYKTTDEFFTTFEKKIDMAFIDADHNCHSALKDFNNVFRLLNDNGIIFMHDTDPISNKYIDPGYCGDSYKIVPLLENRDDINIITIPLTEAGLSIIMKKNSTRTYARNKHLKDFFLME